MIFLPISRQDVQRIVYQVSILPRCHYLRHYPSLCLTSIRWSSEMYPNHRLNMSLRIIGNINITRWSKRRRIQWRYGSAARFQARPPSHRNTTLAYHRLFYLLNIPRDLYGTTIVIFFKIKNYFRCLTSHCLTVPVSRCLTVCLHWFLQFTVFSLDGVEGITDHLETCGTFASATYSYPYCLVVKCDMLCVTYYMLHVIWNMLHVMSV